MRDTFLHSIEAFTQVVEQQSISGAARRLGLTQPTVSLQIRMLEKRLGVRLVDRVGRRSVPTPAGAAFLKHAQAITGAVFSALEDMSQLNTVEPQPKIQNAEQLHLGIEPSAAFLLPPAFWRALRQRLPELEVKVSSWPTAQIAEGLEKGRIDIGLVLLPPAGHSFDVRSILHDELLLIASKKDARLPLKLTPAALCEFPLLVYDPGGEMRGLLQGWFAKAGFHPLMKIGDMEVIKRLVMAGLGYSILPGMALSRKERDKLALRRLTPRLYRKLALVVKEGDRPLSHSAQEAIALFHKLATTMTPGPAEFPLQHAGA
jgi:DNA-binding transcriptional LysR family regulator